MGYRLIRLDEPVLIAMSKPLLTEFDIHHRLESCDRLQRTNVYQFTLIFYKYFTFSFQKQYEENFQTFLVVSTTLIILVSLLFCCCVWRRIRARKAAKKRHFTRLVNDLNASERFTLVAPSDDESD